MSVFLIEGAYFLLTCLFVVPCFLFSLLACWLVHPSLLWPFLLKQAPPAPFAGTPAAPCGPPLLLNSRPSSASGDITDRALSSGISNSGWTAEEIQEGMTKTYAVDIIGVSRFLYSNDGVKFLKDQTRSYFPYWTMTPTSVVALRSAIIADSIDGEISSAGIMAELPVDFRLADTCGTYDGTQNVCAPHHCEGDAQCTSLLSWYVFLPACIQANSVLPEPAARPAYVAPARPLW